jgi:glycosyltransferase involved in cell wall biosynthesis
MNIGIFTEMEPVDGQGRFNMLQARWLQEHGHRVVLFCPDSPQLSDIADSGIIHVPIKTVRQAQPINYHELVEDVARLARACAEYGIEALLATAKLPFMMASGALKDVVPVYLPILSDVYFVDATRENVALMQRAAQEGRVIAYSPDTPKAHASAFGFDLRDIRYSAFPIGDRTATPTRPPAVVRDELGFGADELMVLTICRLDVDKAPAIPALSHATAKVAAATGRRIRLVVVGDGRLADETRAKSHPSTSFIGSRYDLPDLYAACDIYAGEATTILEAAVAKRPVVITCASSHPQTPQVTRGLYGLHVLDYAFLDWSNHAPPTSFEEALALLLDSSLRERLGQVAYDTAMARNHVDVTMPWLVDVLAGKPVPNSLFLEDAAATIAVPGASDDGIDAIGKLCFERGSELRLSVTFDQPVPWGRTLAMPQEHVQALSLAARRIVTASTPRARFVENRLIAGDDAPQAIHDAFAAIADELPPTSTEPPFALSPPRTPLHLVVASDEDAAERVLATLTATPSSAIITWIPENFTNARAQALMRRMEQLTKAGLVIMGQRIPWTLVGRLFAAVDSYDDDGSPQFENYRRLAQQLSRNGKA